MKNRSIKLSLASGAVGLLLSGCQKTEDVRPNIVLILADDLGFSDLGCYGGEIHTPNIDNLARNGLRYTHFCNAGRSCPSRACLLTGLYSHQAGVGHMVADRGIDGYHGTLVQNSVTIAEALQGCGYQTALAGKWHVCNNIDPEGDISQWPMQRGFERYYGNLNGYADYWNPDALFEGNSPVKAEGDYYYTEAITEHACNYIAEMSEAGQPFFLYVSYTAPHYPLHARQEYINHYKGKYAAGWDSLRMRRFERIKELGILPQSATLPEQDPQCYPWAEEEYKEWQQTRMEVYAAMVEQMDEGVGQIVNKIKECTHADNTLVIFLSDNGASSEGHLYNTIERSGAVWKKDDMFTKDGRKITPGDIPGLVPGDDDTFGSYGPQWAHLSCTPFKRYKSWVHEGGICAPMVVCWPSRIKDCGAIRRSAYCINDLLPTFLEIAGGEYPDSIRGLKTIPIESVSFANTFMDDSACPDRLMFWEHEGNRAVRQGRWKLVSEYPGAWKTLRPYPSCGRWELYDIETDPTETCDLAAERPELVDSLASLWREWASRSGVRDWKEIGGENWY